SASLLGFNGSAASSSVGNTTPTTSSASYSSLASLSSSGDFEIGSSNSPGIGVSSFDMPVAPERIFDRPTIILGCPRSGTTLLFETLAQCANAWTIGSESFGVIDRRTPRFDSVLPRDKVEDRGNRLDASDDDPDACKPGPAWNAPARRTTLSIKCRSLSN